MITNESTNEIVIHRFIRKIRREMSWRKRSLGLNSQQANTVFHIHKFQKKCISWLDYIARSMKQINSFVVIHSQQMNLPLDTYLSTSKLSPIIQTLKKTAFCLSIQLKQAELTIDNMTVIYRSSNTYYLSDKKNRTINELTDTQAYEWTRFTKVQLHKLLELFHLPHRFTVHQTHHFDSEFVLLLTLSYFANGENLSTLKCKFGGNPDFFTSVIKVLVQHLFELFYHRISGDSLSFYTEKDFRSFAEVIYERVKISPKEVDKYEKGLIDEIKEIQMSLSQFRPLGNIDDTSINSCRPGSGPIGKGGKFAERREHNHDIQKAMYSGYAKQHGLKSQAINFPNGMWGSIWVCALKHNDLGVLNMSGLCEYLLDKLPMVKDENGNDIHMVIYGDAIFKPSSVILRRIENPETDVDKLLNNRMNSCRTSIEMMFGEVFSLFKLLGAKRKMKLYKNGRYNRKLIIIIFFLHNCYTCMNGNSVSSMFNMIPPNIEDYLHLDDNHSLHTDEDDEVPLGYTYDYGNKQIVYDSNEDIIMNDI